MLSPCRWHYSHTKSYVPRPLQSSSPVQSQSQSPVSGPPSPIPDQSQSTPSCRASNELPISLSPAKGTRRTDTRTEAPALTHATASHPGKRSRSLSTQQPDQANPIQADPYDIPERCWKRKVVAKKDGRQPVLVADPRTCPLPSPCLLLFFYFEILRALFFALGADRAIHTYPCDRRRQP